MAIFEWHEVVILSVIQNSAECAYSTVKSRNYEGPPSALFTSLLRDNSL